MVIGGVMLKQNYNKVYNRLTIDKVAFKKGTKQLWATCSCNCGNTTHVPLYRILSGNTQSCGCLGKSRGKINLTTHGKNKTREHRAWVAIRRRCNNPNTLDAKLYRSKGIKVCKRWDKFLNFLKDMGKCPPGYSIDRIDNNKNYCPSNCRWATALEQGNNTSRNVKFTYKGETMNMSQWARRLGIPYCMLKSRWHRKWPLDRMMQGRLPRKPSLARKTNK